MLAACRGCKEASLNTLHHTNAENQRLLDKANAIVAPIMGAPIAMPMLAGVR